MTGSGCEVECVRCGGGGGGGGEEVCLRREVEVIF